MTIWIPESLQHLAQSRSSTKHLFIASWKTCLDSLFLLPGLPFLFCPPPQPAPLKQLVPKSLATPFCQIQWQSCLFISVLSLFLFYTWPSLLESLPLLGIWGTVLFWSCSHVINYSFLVFFTCSSSSFWPLNVECPSMPGARFSTFLSITFMALSTTYFVMIPTFMSLPYSYLEYPDAYAYIHLDIS